ncbi:hypothetical protein [Methylobacterium aquaticum]|uniref:Uncharacterized protein n=1 Tax=Methylobacterium aquaticum TaxID=270351 RepID=A0A0C6FXK9_9HYPH|nr:hypothetical protein [Methylobacterium aquaticum]BAQ50289.1 hypothetical protein Maq22A_3p50190 [Methylobacterium aquaticum]
MPTSSTSTEQKAPSRLRVNISGEDRDLFMSFGLLNEVASLVGSPEGVPTLSFNPPTAHALLELVLAKRDKRGNILRDDEEPIVPHDLDPDVGETIIDWAGAHVLDFFIRRFKKSAQLFATQAENLAAVGSSLTSSVNSPGKTA